ncbi:MAG: 6-phosphofructokinase [Clostridiales bacterium]|nr:6-phosphofructokinase [Clostridiales bacterium]
MKKNILVGQSGGPTAVINGSLYGVVAQAKEHKKDRIDHIYGMINGIEGFLKDRYMDMETDMSFEEFEALKTTPGAYLGSCRFKLPSDLNDPVYARLFDKFNRMNIGYVLYIGGNDSMDTVSKLSRCAKAHNSDIRIIGIPKTIDNDLVCTDHTPGFGSAARFVATSVREIGIDASIYDTNSVTIVEIMGRHAGWLTGAAVLARKHKKDNPVYIYLPEENFSTEQFVEDIKKALEYRKNIVVCVSEGIHDAQGRFICEYEAAAGTDNFGHKMLAGCGKYLENLIRIRLGIKVRSVELNVSQRCSSVRQSKTDLDEAIEAGRFSVDSAMRGESGKMAAFVRVSDMPYKMECGLVDVNDVCNKEKKVPLSWITDHGTDISEDFIQYVLPLIQGSISLPEENGIPVFAYRREDFA